VYRIVSYDWYTHSTLAHAAFGTVRRDCAKRNIRSSPVNGHCTKASDGRNVRDVDLNWRVIAGWLTTAGTVRIGCIAVRRGCSS